MKDFYGRSSYVFVLCHPDDEMYAICTIKALKAMGKQVDLVYITNGDFSGEHIGILRQEEAIKAAQLIGIEAPNLHLLGYSERTIDGAVHSIQNELNRLVSKLSPDCIVGHDFEGGHHMHDIASFCTQVASRESGANLWVFPSYHHQPHNRLWNQFIEGRKTDFSLKLNKKQAAFKSRVFDAHATQKQYFDRLLAGQGKDTLLTREVLRLVDKDIDFTVQPTTPIGYEYTGSPTSYETFQKAIDVTRRPRRVTRLARLTLATLAAARQTIRRYTLQKQR